MLAAPAFAATSHEFSSAFGGSGTNALNDPTGVAVDNSGGPSAHDIYVTDTANHRVEKFSPSGKFILMFGKEVNETKVKAAASEAERTSAPQLRSTPAKREPQALLPEPSKPRPLSPSTTLRDLPLATFSRRYRRQPRLKVRRRRDLGQNLGIGRSDRRLAQLKPSVPLQGSPSIIVAICWFTGLMKRCFVSNRREIFRQFRDATGISVIWGPARDRAGRDSG